MAKLKIALFGNQNSGKTTLFNALTGADQYVGNWPGVTVDRVSGIIKSRDFEVQDLPGLYSLSPYSPEEIVSRDYILNGDYDVIVNIVDATHLERSLSLSLELLSFKKKMVIALNMMDKVHAQNIDIDIKKLEEQLGVTVVPISASKRQGLDELLDAVEKANCAKDIAIYPEDIRNELDNLAVALKLDGDTESKLFITSSILQFDKVYCQKYENDEMSLVEISKARARVESKYKLDCESLLAKFRYNYIDGIVDACVTKDRVKKNDITKRIDDIVTNKYLAIPIFLFIVYIVYYLAVTTIGTMGTDYANDVIFGTYAVDAANSALSSLDSPEWLTGLIVDGIIGGVGAVLGFVPQMIVLFFLLALLEQCGYMTRVAFVLDRIFRHFGLSGRSFIPMIIATGCGVPAIMATKAIDNINEKRITVITATFVPCSAKLPIIVMITAAFFSESSLVAPAMYALAIVSIIVTALILKKGAAFNEEVSPFVMELPDYSMPVMYNVLRSVYNRCKAFVVKAGTIIFTTVVVVWFLSNFNFTASGFGMVDVSESLLAVIGSAIAFIFIPLGFSAWQSAVAIFTGLLAKENVVGTLAVLLGLGEVAEDDATLSQALTSEFTTAAALSFLAFNLFSTPCVAALGAMRRELVSKKMFAFSCVYLIGWAYVLSFIIYNIAGLVLGELTLSASSIIAFALIMVIVYMIVRPQRAKVGLKIPAKLV